MNAKHICLLGLVWLSVSSSFAQIYGWSQAASSPTNTARNDDIYFLDPTNGWAVSGGGSQAAGVGGGGIWKTTDGGNTWTKKFEKIGTHFRSVGFLSSLRGFAGNLGAGSYDTFCTDTNVLYQTTDGGETWTNVPALNAAGMKGFCAFHVLDSQTIYGAGRVRGPAYFVKSTDAGTNWTVVNLTAMGVMNGIMDVYFKDSTNGFAVGMDTNAYNNCSTPYYHGAIARTTNGGVTWSTVATTPERCCYFWKMSWPSPEIGYVSLQQNTTMTNHIFYKTIDGGNTWTPYRIPFSQIGSSSFYWQGVGFVSTNEGWAGGDGATAPYLNNFLHTVDGGASWTRVGYTDSRRINRIRFKSPEFGYASGLRIHIYRLWLNIDTQPSGQWVTSGSSLNLSVAASGESPFSYQWRKNGTNILSATNAILSLTNVGRADSGGYTVFVSNARTNLVSSNATLRVLVPQKMASPQLDGTKVKLLFGDAGGGLLTTNELDDFEVQSSTNLSQWSPLTNSLLLTNGLMLIEDEPDFAQKFYRVLER